MKSARQTAFEILNRIQRDNSYSNLVLDSTLEKADVQESEKRFVSALVYGVTERKITIDYNLSLYLSQPIKKLKPEVLTVLRLGAYQILFMDKVPESAAVNESVKLAKKNGSAFASGLVNAVLRKISKNGLKTDGSMSVRYSAPQWLCEMWTKSYGIENAEKILASTFGSTNPVIRVNNLKTSADDLINNLQNEGFDCEINFAVDNSVLIKNGGAIHKSKAFKSGLFHVQDTASQLCCKALDAKEGERVLDVCAAPGGKSFTIAENMNNIGKVFSCDIYNHRLDLISDGAKRLGISCIETVNNDGSKFNPSLPSVDKILCDVPCSGLGVIGKKPEIRFKEKAEVDKLKDLQYSILCISSQYLNIGGHLVYSTCSLNPDENENIIEKFLAEHDNYESVRILPELTRYGKNTDYITLMPHIHGCDGFFISCIKRVK